MKNGEKAFIDPRYMQKSKEEKILCELIEKCHKYEPDERPSIFDIVATLQMAV